MNSKAITATKRAAIRERLESVYGEDVAQQQLPHVAKIIDSYRAQVPEANTAGWSERDVVLITYGDQVRAEHEPPLQALTEFFSAAGLATLINTIHILPFFPSSSDDGFSVIDYRQVDPALGSWSDVGKLGEQSTLMFDLVLNHISRQSEWFQAYLAGKSPFDRYFIEADPQADLSTVTRPRSLPLLTPVDTVHGPRHVWTTFSPDQIDLNFANPDVLSELLEVLLFYVSRGARIVRLDAIAYLWKEIGTSCIHLEQTHAIVKLMRAVLDEVAPHVLLLTETNVPHDENVSYFGDRDEAHLVYQFSLPPLLLDALLNQDAVPFMRWLSQLESPARGTTYFNFTASHDGIGVRPLEGLVPPERWQRLIEAVHEKGGYVGMRQNADGSESPYELNITYFDILGPASSDDADFGGELHVRRFLASQAVMLSLQGIPGVYFHSLVGTPNDAHGAASSGIPRRINRRKYACDELMALISGGNKTQSRVYDGYRKLLEIRIRQQAFHPDAAQRALPVPNETLIAFTRTSVAGRQSILVLLNTADESCEVDVHKLVGATRCTNLLNDRTYDDKVTLDAFECVWFDYSQDELVAAP